MIRKVEPLKAVNKIHYSHILAQLLCSSIFLTIQGLFTRAVCHFVIGLELILYRKLRQKRKSTSLIQLFCKPANKMEMLLLVVEFIHLEW